jgi:hypothetical protein
METLLCSYLGPCLRRDDIRGKRQRSALTSGHCGLGTKFVFSRHRWSLRSAFLCARAAHAGLAPPKFFALPPSRLRHFPGTPAGCTYPCECCAQCQPNPPSSSGLTRGSRSDFPRRTKLAVISPSSPLATPDLIRGHFALPPLLSAFATPAPPPILKPLTTRSRLKAGNADWG